MVQLLDLPLEILTRIIASVVPGNFLACSQVCQKLRDIIFNTLSLIHLRVLESSGVRENPSNSLLLPDRIIKVVEYDIAWRSLSWTTRSEIHITVDDWWSFNQTITDISLPTQLGMNTARIIRIPSPLREFPACKWDLNLPESFTIKGLDPSQDLIIVTHKSTSESESFSVRPLQLSTGKPHPSAKSQSFYVGQGRCHEISLCDDQLLMHVVVHPGLESSHEVYNWTTGSHIKSIKSDAYHYHYLDPEHLISLHTGGSIGIYAHPGHTNASPTECLLLAKFILPNLYRAGYRWTEVSRSSAPSHASMPTGNFSLNPNDTLVSVMITDGDPEGEDNIWVELLVPTEVLLSYIPKSSAGPRTVSWDEWGPSHAYIFPHYDNGERPPLYGLRALPSPHPLQCGDGSWIIQIHDYHPQRVAMARLQASRNPGAPRNWVIREGGTLEGRYTGDGEPLDTYAPHIVTTRELPDDLLGDSPGSLILGIQEDCIIIHKNTAPHGVLNAEWRVPIDLHIFSF